MQCIVHSSLHLSDLWWWSSDEKPIHCDLGRTMAHHGPSWPIMAHHGPSWPIHPTRLTCIDGHISSLPLRWPSRPTEDFPAWVQRMRRFVATRDTVWTWHPIWPHSLPQVHSALWHLQQNCAYLGSYCIAAELQTLRMIVTKANLSSGLPVGRATCQLNLFSQKQPGMPASRSISCLLYAQEYWCNWSYSDIRLGYTRLRVVLSLTWFCLQKLIGNVVKIRHTFAQRARSILQVARSQMEPLDWLHSDLRGWHHDETALLGTESHSSLVS